MATAGVKSKSATETLLDKVTQMLTARSKEMSDKEFQTAVKGSREVISRVRASRGRRGEKA